VNDDARRLELARAAWLGAMPSETEVALGARRIELRLGARPGRRGARRGLVLVVLGILFGGTALAYVASRIARVDRASEPGQSVKPVAESLPRTSSSERAEPPAVPEQRETSPALPGQAETSLPSAQPLRRPARSAPSADTTSWKDVDEALSAHDSARAEAALERLAESPDVTVRAKAQLGRAQLRAARGDCAAATRIVAELTRTPGVSEQLLGRGRELVRRCR